MCRIPAGLKTRGNFLQLSDIALGFSACGARAIVTFEECGFVRLQIGLRGYASTVSGRASTIVHVAQPCVTSPGRAATLDYGPGFEHLVLRVNADAVRRKLSAIIGANPGQPLEFEPATFTSLRAVQGLQNLIAFFARQFDEDTARFSPLVISELQEAIIVGLLCASRNNFSALLEQGQKDPAPAQVRRAEAYIEANHTEPVTVEKLVQVTGVSARALFNAFQKSRGYSPMAFAKTVRMKRARQMLRRVIQRHRSRASCSRAGFPILDTLLATIGKHLASGRPKRLHSRGASNQSDFTSRRAEPSYRCPALGSVSGGDLSSG